MCGLTGAVWTAEGAAVELQELKDMTQVLRHRGPDAGGMLYATQEDDRWIYQQYDSEREVPKMMPTSGPGCALGHRRLSIIDLSTVGNQPLSNEDGTIWTVFNGEIYNYRDLVRELKSRGHVFRTETDTEVIVHLYEQYGDAFLSHLRGMFALAVWDSRGNRLLLARDRLGQKPLMYRVDEGRMAFASELKSLLQIRNAPREIRPQSIDEYLTYQYIPHPSCILEGYFKLPPAHYAIFEEGHLKVDSYWSPPYAIDVDREAPMKSEEYWKQELRQTTERSSSTPDAK